MRKFGIQNLSIRTKVTIFFAVFFVTILTRYIYNYNHFENLEKYQTIINIAAQNGDVIQQIAIHASQMLERQNDTRDLIAKDIFLAEENFEIIRNGGNRIINDKEFALPPCDADAIPALLLLEETWRNYRKDAALVSNTELFEENTVSIKDTGFSKIGSKKIITINNNVKNAILRLQDNSSEIAKLNEQFIDTYFEILEEQKAYANTLLRVFLFINMGFIVLGFITFRTLVFKPLKKVMYIADFIGKGDLTRKVEYTNQDEIGSVALALNRMIDKIMNATDFIKSIEDGDLESSYHNLDGDNLKQDTLAMALINMQTRIKQVDQIEGERNWVTEGLAMFAEILQNYNSDIETLSFEIISNIVKYTHAAQGGIFILNNENPNDIHLELSSSYAYQRRRYLKKRIEVGEGLVGQCYKDADMIYLTEIPHDYSEISSGLGQSLPKSLLVIPLKLNELVYGVMELASFNEFKKYEIEFLQRLSENIAATINSTQANDRTKKLLEESNLITEQMQLQEKEMLKNLQQLQYTQEEMKKNQEVLSAQSYAMKTALINLELDMDQNIIAVNDIFFDIMGYSEKEILHKKYAMLVPKELIDNEYKDVWDSLREGIPVTGSYKRIAEDGSERWIRSTYSPIKDINNKPYKVIEAGFDVTLEKTTRLDFQQQLNSFKRFNAFVEFDMQGNYTDVNERFLEIVEYSREEIIGFPHTTIVFPEEKEKSTHSDLWDRLRNGEFYLGEVRRQTKTGKEVWFQVSFNPIIDLDGKPYKVIEFITDITERVHKDQEIAKAQAESQARLSNLSAIINSSEDIIITLNERYLITTFNDKAQILYGEMGVELVYGLHISETFPESKKKEFQALYEKAFKGEQFSVEEFIYNPKNFSATLYTMVFYPTLDEGGKQNGIAVFLKNVAERKKQEKEFDKLKRQVDTYKKSIDKLEQERASLRKELKEKDEVLAQIKK